MNTATATLETRMAPHNLEAERGVLGGILRDPDTLPDVQAILKSEHLFSDAHQKLYRAACDLAADGKPVDLVSVNDLIRRRQQAADTGGPVYLAELWEAVPSAANVEYHARIVLDAAKTRAVIHASNELLRDAYDRVQSADELVALAERKVLAIADDDAAADDLCGADALAREALDRIDTRAGRDGPDGLATGFDDLDALLSGLRAGQLVVIGARPACGKTALALAVAAHNSAAGVGTLFVSLEMPRAEISDRILSMRSGVPLRAIQRGRLDGEQPAAVIAAARSFSREPFAIIDAADLTAARLGSIVRRAVRRRGVKLVVIDYLQLLRPENDRDPRHLQVGTLARRVKQLARACGVPVVLLAQLNRESENRTGGKPRLADLRESGEIEAHADAAILIHPRPDQPADAPVWLSDLIVAKNRNGPVGEVALEYQRPLTRFANAARR